VEGKSNKQFEKTIPQFLMLFQRLQVFGVQQV
jgi:hypothetical protein